MNLFHFSLLHGPSRQNESVGRAKRGEKKKRISLEKPRYRCVSLANCLLKPKPFNTTVQVR